MFFGLLLHWTWTLTNQRMVDLQSFIQLFVILLASSGSYIVQGDHIRGENGLERRIVVAPPVISPNHSTVWHVGQEAILSWYVFTKKHFTIAQSLTPLPRNLTNIDPSFLPPGSQGTFVLGNPRNVSISKSLASFSFTSISHIRDSPPISGGTAVGHEHHYHRSRCTRE